MFAPSITYVITSSSEALGETADSAANAFEKLAAALAQVDADAAVQRELEQEVWSQLRDTHHVRDALLPIRPLMPRQKASTYG